jgi:chemotaxis protein methyltransferase CheR
MTQQIPPELLSQFSDFLTAKIGLCFTPKSWPDLARGVKAAARDLGQESAEQCMRQLMLSPLTRQRIEILASHLTVGETYFFRENRSLEVLENHILPELVRARRGQGRRLRIWSAGCASGEEAYTLAILLHRLIPDIKDWRIHLLATDINAKALQKAGRGLYGKWSFRSTSPEITARYFLRRERGWEILPFLKDLVTFEYFNLVEDPYPALVSQTNAMDLILCRNVLMYFSAAQSRKVLKNLSSSLVEGGWLLVSLTETSHVRFSPLVVVNFPEATVYRKDSQASDQPEFVKTCPVFQPTSSLADQAIKPPVFPAALEPAPPPASQAETPRPERPPEPPIVAASRPEVAGPPDDRVRDMIGSARNCANLGDLAGALSWSEQALAVDRLNPAWHYLRAAILQEQDAVAEAILSLRKAVYLDQDFVMAHFALGNLALRQGNTRAAHKHFDNVLLLLDNYPPEEPLPESEGLTSARLKEIVLATIAMRKLGERKAATK